MREIYYFIKYNKRKKLSLYILILTLWYRFLILTVPVKKLQKGWGVSGEESSSDVIKWKSQYAGLVSFYVNYYADRTIWESKCLVRALTARHLLNRMHITNTMYLGVGKDENGKMIAHAWLRCGREFVTGGNGEDYSTVAKYASFF